MGIDQLSELHIYDKPLGGIIGRCACEINPPTKMDVGVLNIFFLSSFGDEVHELLLAKDRNTRKCCLGSFFLCLKYTSVWYYFFSLISCASIVV